MDTPVTTTVIIVCLAVFGYLWNKRVEFESVAMSYRKVVADGEIWRTLTCTWSHLDLMHVIMNVYGLWSCRDLEATMGSYFYLKTTLLLMVVSPILSLACYHVLIKQLGMAHYEYVFSLGYSCVVFGMMTVVAQFQPQFGFPLPGGAVLPVNLAPFGSLFLTQLLIRRASFVGHLAGIVAGYMISFGLFDGVTPYWLYSTLALLGVAIVCNVRETTNVRIPCVDLTTDGPVCTSHSGAMAGMMQNAAPQPVEDEEEDVVGMGAGAARGGVGRGYPEGPGSWV